MVFWKGHLHLKNVDLYAVFSKKVDPYLRKCGPLCMIFWKKVDLDLKRWIFYVFFSKISGPLYMLRFSEKIGPLPEKCGPFPMIYWKKVDLALKRWTCLRMIFWYMWSFIHVRFSEKVDLNLKMWTFSSHFLKKVALYHSKVDFYAWFSEIYVQFSEKSGP